ncbi:MAG: nuclease A inhibitor family protein [Bacteroidota bacterium]
MKLQKNLKILLLSIFTVTLIASCGSDSSPVAVTNNSPQKVLKTGLSDITVGLFYSSQTEYPFDQVNYVDASTAQNLLKELALPLETPVQEVGFDNFFENLTKIDDNTDAGQRAKAKRYADMQQLLKTNLTELKVYRVGDETKVGIYILGKFSDGSWTGLRTYSIEKPV